MSIDSADSTSDDGYILQETSLTSILNLILFRKMIKALHMTATVLYLDD